MNIVALFEILSIDRTKVERFSPEEIIRIEKQLNVEKRINPEIDTNTASNFIQALKNNPKELQFVLNNRILYNFFAKSNLTRDNFPRLDSEINNDAIQSFIQLYLEEDLKLFFDQRMAENKFEEMSDMLEVKTYFPEDFLFNLGKKSMVKIDFAMSRMNQGMNTTSDIDYIKRRSFYDFLGHFRSIEMDEKVKLILNKVVELYNTNNRYGFAKDALIALSYYNPFEEDFKQTLHNNRNVVEQNQGRSSSSSNWSGAWTSIFFFVFLLIKFAFSAKSCSSNNSYDASNSVNFDNISVENNASMQLYYDRVNHDVDSMFNYLVDFNKDKLVHVQYNDTLQTGDNPYQYLFNNHSYSKPNSGIMVHNNSEYDVVMFEKVLFGGSHKIPQQASFIKSKQSYEIRPTGSINYRTFCFYAGKKLATFHEVDELPIVQKNSTEEPRFIELPSNAKEVLSVDYFLKDDVYIQSANGKVSIVVQN